MAIPRARSRRAIPVLLIILASLAFGGPALVVSHPPHGQVRMLLPAADSYTVIVTRSKALAASKTIPATLLPISEVISEHCRP